MNDNTQGLTDAERCPNGVAFEHKAGHLPDHCRVCRLLSDAYAAGFAARGDAATEAIERVRTEERERIARCLRAEAHGRNDAAFNRALTFAAGCVLAQYDQHDAHSYCPGRATCPRCSATAALDAAPAPTQGTEPYEEPNQ